MKTNYFNYAILILVITSIKLFPAGQKQSSLLQQKPKAPSVNLVTSNINNVTFKVQINGILTSEKKIAERLYDQLSIPDGEVIMQEGSPQVPIITKLVAIPDCDDVTISVIPSNKMDFANINVAPVPNYDQKKFKDGSDRREEIFNENKFIYSTNNDFPGKYGEIIETGYVRSQKVARIAIYPVQFNPVNKKIKVFTDFEVNLSFVNPSSQINKELGIFRNMMHNSALNYVPDGISASTKRKEILSDGNLSKQFPGKVLEPAVNRFTYLNLLKGPHAIPVDYLIITHSSLFNSNSLTRLANHRREYNGFDVAIVQADDITGSENKDCIYEYYPGMPHYQAIREFISDVYKNGKANNTLDGHLGFILLVGDAYQDDDVTEMLPGAKPNNYCYLIESSDFYYASLGGHKDHLLDLMYGRLSVGNEIELNNVVNKIISYEYNYNRNWKESCTFVSFSPDLFGRSDASIKNLTEIIPNSCYKSYAYRAKTLNNPTTVNEVDTIFGQIFSEEDYYDPAKDCGAHLLDDWLYDKINEGSQIFIYEGHGGCNTLGAGEGSGRFIFKTDELQNRLQNNFFSFMIFTSCETGHFDNGPADQGDCLAEGIVNLADRGAIGCLAPVRETTTKSFGTVDGLVIKAMFKDQMHLMGEAIMQSKIEMSEDLPRIQYNLYGDPAVNLWPDINVSTTGSQNEKSQDHTQKYSLGAYPNPFNPATTICFSIPAKEHVTIKVFDILGSEVTTLINEEKQAGNYKLNFNGSNLSSGIYVYTLIAGSYSISKKIILMK